MTGKRIATAMVGLLSYLTLIEIQFACMNFEFAPTFRRAQSPDGPMRQYLEGQLGIVSPALHHTYLFWAYRNLAGGGFSEAERRTLLPHAYDSAPQQTALQPDKAAFQVWEESRQRVKPGAAAQFTNDWEAQRRRWHPDDWTFFLNCPNDAYLNAAATLDERVGRFGAASPEVGEWMAAQEVVFLNCPEGRHIPARPPVGLDPLIAKDREYQIAAAHFYAQEYEEAAARFEKIGRDSQSPWRQWGEYLAARSFIRKGTLVEGYGKFDSTSLGESARRLQAVLGNAGLSERHESARELLDYVRLRLESGPLMLELSARLRTGGDARSLDRNWLDYDWLLDRGFEGDEGDDLTDWLRLMRSDGEGALSQGVERWRETQQPHWLVLVLSKIQAGHEAVPVALLAASSLPRESPAFLTAAYHRARLLINLGEGERARTEIDEILWKSPLEMPVSARNELLAMRLPLARDFEDFLRAAPRQPLSGPSIGLSKVDSSVPVSLDADSLVVFNEQLPLERLLEAARSDQLPVEIREEIALAAWCRAALIGNEKAETEARPLVAASRPELANALQGIAETAGAEARRFAVVDFLLRYPGIRPHMFGAVKRTTPIAEIDNLRDNWWCRMGVIWPMHDPNYWKRDTSQNTDENLAVPAGPALAPAGFLSDAERRNAASQLAALKEIGAAPNYLSDQVVRWGRAHPEDPRVPEALHLAVRATRYGCEDSETTRFSKAAFQLLHGRFPGSEWAGKTKYWY